MESVLCMQDFVFDYHLKRFLIINFCMSALVSGDNQSENRGLAEVHVVPDTLRGSMSAFVAVPVYSRLLFLSPMDQGSRMISGDRRWLLTRVTSRDDPHFRQFSSIQKFPLPARPFSLTSTKILFLSKHFSRRYGRNL